MCHDELFSYDILGQASGEVTCKVDWSRSNWFSWVWLRRSSLAHVVWFRRWVRGWGTQNIFIGHYYSWCHPRPHPLGPLSWNDQFVQAWAPAALVSGGWASHAHSVLPAYVPGWTGRPDQAVAGHSMESDLAFLTIRTSLPYKRSCAVFLSWVHLVAHYSLFSRRGWVYFRNGFQQCSGIFDMQNQQKLCSDTP